MKEKKRKPGLWFYLIGLLVIATGIVLSVWNF